MTQWLYRFRWHASVSGKRVHCLWRWAKNLSTIKTLKQNYGLSKDQWRLKRKKNKMLFDKCTNGTIYRNIGSGWKSHINLRSRWLNKQIITDSSLIKGGYSSKNNAWKRRIELLPCKSRVNEVNPNWGLLVLKCIL